MAATVLSPETEFDPVVEYGKLHVGMQVLMSTEAHGTHPGWGQICGIEGQSVHIWFTSHDSNHGSRQGHLEDCWLINDPRVKSHSHLINQTERRAVFWLSEEQVKINEYARQIATATEAIENLIEKTKALENGQDSLMAELKKLQAIAKAK